MTVTLAQIRGQAQDICDFVNNPQVGTPTWTQWTNDGIEKLYRIVLKLSTGAFETSADVTLSSATNLIPKPAGFRRLLGLTLDPTSPGMRRSLPKYNKGNRDAYGTLGPRRYRVLGDSISVEPFQLAAGNYRIYYVAGPTKLVADGDTMDPVLADYVDYVVTWMCIKALGKEESDNRDLYVELAKVEQDVMEAFAMIDGDDSDTIVDDDDRGPSIWTVP